MVKSVTLAAVALYKHIPHNDPKRNNRSNTPKPSSSFAFYSAIRLEIPTMLLHAGAFLSLSLRHPHNAYQVHAISHPASERLERSTRYTSLTSATESRTDIVRKLTWESDRQSTTAGLDPCRTTFSLAYILFNDYFVAIDGGA